MPLWSEFGFLGGTAEVSEITPAVAILAEEQSLPVLSRTIELLQIEDPSSMMRPWPLVHVVDDAATDCSMPIEVEEEPMPRRDQLSGGPHGCSADGKIRVTAATSFPGCSVLLCGSPRRELPSH